MVSRKAMKMANDRLYYNDNHIRIYNGDCRQMWELQDESVQMVCCSPPYWGLRKYSGLPDLVWGNNHCEHEWGATDIKRMDYVQGNPEFARPHREHKNFTSETNTCSLCGAWKGAYGLEPTPEMYIEHTIEILREIRRILRKDGVVFWNIGDSYLGSNCGYGDYKGNKSSISIPEIYGSIKKPQAKIGKPKDMALIPFRVTIAAQEDGWWVRSVIIWSKPNPMPESVTDRPTESHEYILMLTKSARYYWDASAVREGANSAGATNGATLGSSALAPELGSTLDTDNTTPNLRGWCYLSESQITINGSVTGDAENIEIVKAISLTIIGEQTERQFVMDLRPISGTASLALITSTFKGLSANNTPVRATIVNSPTPPSGAIDADSMFAIPSTNASPTTESVSQALTMLARIAEKGLPALVTIHSEKLESPLLIRGIFRSTHIDHNTINTNRSQAKSKEQEAAYFGNAPTNLGRCGDNLSGRNIRSVWEFPTQPYPEAHFAVFPEKLPEICIKAATPEVGCCSKCGAPWERVTEQVKTVTRPGRNTGTAKSGTNSDPNQALHQGDLSKYRQQISYETLGWQPTCSCNADKVPSLVLDPFAGSGTTLWVAKLLNRQAVGYELSEEYCQLALDRNRQEVMELKI